MDTVKPDFSHEKIPGDISANELLERAESVGENWTFAGVEESEDE